MPGVGGLALLGRPLARVLHRQRRGDDQHLAQAAGPVGLDEHAAQPRVDRQRGERAADGGQLSGPGSSAPSSCSSARPSPTARGSGCSTNGNSARSPRSSEIICRMTDARLVRRISGSVNSGTGVEVVLGVEPDADAVGDAAAAPGALVRAGLADLLDRQPLHLEPPRVAGDPGDAGVDDVADAGHGQRGLGDVRGQHDPAAGVRGEHAVLLGGGQPRVQRQDLGVAEVPLAQRVGGVADLALAGQEDEDVAVPFALQLGDGVADGLELVAVGIGLGVVGVDDRPVAHLDGIGAAGDLDDGWRRSARRTAPGRSSPR